MNIGILGGAFDPVHNGHLLIAKKIIKQGMVDCVWFIPCGKHPFNKELTSPQYRMSMLSLIKDATLSVSDIEIKKEGISYTIDTLLALQKQYPEHSFSLIIGSDNIQDFPRWKDWKMIIEDFCLIIVPREKNIELIKKTVLNYLSLQQIPQSITIMSWYDNTIGQISSREIRKKVQDHESIKGLVPERVEKYIIDNNLYE